MAQFRTTADILDEILQKAGEPTNGNSPYESLAVTYANKAHHAIIGGGNIFNLTVDEPWVWARSRFPIVIELEPAYTTGTITATVNDVNITFSSAPSASLEGWHLQVSGRPTVYKIMKHTAADTSAQLDSSFLEDSGVYNFRAFKLDYEVIPAYVYVDNYNDKIDFQEGTAFTTRTASLTHGAYTLSNLILHAAAQMDTAATSSITGGYDSVLKQNAVTCSSSFKMLGATGSNKRRSALPLLGFDRIDHTGAQTYTAAYTPNSIARLIEPFRIFSVPAGSDKEFIYSTDPIKMQEDYPISMTEQRIPDRFVRLTEENDGTVWVRFNAYPRYKTKIVMDWIPTPEDLQDNAASFPKLPRGDVDTLIHGAAAFIAFDKEDTKFDSLIKLTEAGLQSMKKKNHWLLHRTGEFFGQIVPRADLQVTPRRLNFGYTVSGTTAAQTTAESVQSMIAVTISYSSVQTAATVGLVTARTLPTNRSLFALIAKHSTPFTGAGITSVSVSLGISGDATRFINGFSVNQATAASAQESSLVLYYPAAETPIIAQFTSVGGDLSALTQGSLVLYFQETIVT